MFIAFFWTFTYHRVPETKNRTFDEIAELFKIRREDHQLEESSADHQSILQEETMSNGCTKPGVIIDVPFASHQPGKN